MAFASNQYLYLSVLVARGISEQKKNTKKRTVGRTDVNAGNKIAFHHWILSLDFCSRAYCSAMSFYLRRIYREQSAPRVLCSFVTDVLEQEEKSICALFADGGRADQLKGMLRWAARMEQEQKERRGIRLMMIICDHRRLAFILSYQHTGVSIRMNGTTFQWQPYKNRGK